MTALPCLRGDAVGSDDVAGSSARLSRINAASFVVSGIGFITAAAGPSSTRCFGINADGFTPASEFALLT